MMREATNLPRQRREHAPHGLVESDADSTINGLAHNRSTNPAVQCGGTFMSKYPHERPEHPLGLSARHERPPEFVLQLQTVKQQLVNSNTPPSDIERSHNTGRTVSSLHLTGT